MDWQRKMKRAADADCGIQPDLPAQPFNDLF
jgi:hypothetical protein